MGYRRDMAVAVVDGQSTWWDRSWATFDRWTPYALLGFSTVLSVLSPHPWGTRAATLGLAGAAAAWIAIGHTTAPDQRRTSPGLGLVYVGVLLGFAALLMSRDMIFFIFAISGFFHAASLRPLPMVFVGTGSTAFLILYFTWGGIPQATGELVVFVSILVIQTFLIGFGVAGGERMTELSEQRRLAVAALEATLAETRPSTHSSSSRREWLGSTRTPAHGSRDPRHPRPGPDRGDHPTRSRQPERG